MSKLKVELHDYSHTCGDGCCDIYGTITKVNDVQLELHNSDTATIIQQLLEHLGYEVEIIITDDYD